MSLMIPALVWDVPGANSETRIQEQVIYWEVIPGNTGWEQEVRERRKMTIWAK